MTPKILILDDDAGFNTLLTNIFSKAKVNYNIVSSKDPQEAVELIKKDTFDLLITDHKMPHMTGLEFAKTVREINSLIPIIMVSANLDDETIRNLININVDCIFLKPLNIFSLLEKTAHLVTVSKEKSLQDNTYLGSSSQQNKSAYEASFRTFPCKDKASYNFAQTLFEKSTFTSYLLISGETGAPFSLIIEDLERFYSKTQQKVSFIPVKDSPKEDLLSFIEKKRNEIKEATPENVITFCFFDTVDLTSEVVDQWENILKWREALEDNHMVRYIFCLHGDLDALLESNLISPTLYLRLGNNEIQVPPLRKLPNDLLLLAKNLISDFWDKSSPPPVLSSKVKKIFKSYPWPGNYEELKSAIQTILPHISSKEIEEEHLQKHLSDIVAHPLYETVSERLEYFRQDYAQAVYFLNNKDESKSYNFLQISPELFKAILNN